MHAHVFKDIFERSQSTLSIVATLPPDLSLSLYKQKLGAIHELRIDGTNWIRQGHI